MAFTPAPARITRASALPASRSGPATLVLRTISTSGLKEASFAARAASFAVGSTSTSAPSSSSCCFTKVASLSTMRIFTGTPVGGGRGPDGP